MIIAILEVIGKMGENKHWKEYSKQGDPIMVLKTVSEYAEGRRKSKPGQRLYDRPITE